MVVMVVSSSMATVYNAHVVRFVFLKFQWFTGFYRYVVNFQVVADATRMCSIANLSYYSCLVTQTRNDMK